MRLVQISDTHVFANKNTALLGLNTWDSFVAVVDSVLADKKPPDMVFLTGDISQDYSAAAYFNVAEQLQNFRCPVYWLPGNHDAPAAMWKTFSSTQLKPDKLIHWQNWTFILLDTHYPHHTAGMLAKRQLEWLKQQLAHYTQQHVMIFLHHPPLLVNSEWLDKSTLQNPQDFFAITDNYKQIRGIACGHVHQVFETVRNGVPILSAPSTGIQFLPQSQNFALDMVNPGYRWFEFKTNGTFTTGIERLRNFHNTVDFSATGY